MEPVRRIVWLIDIANDLLSSQNFQHLCAHNLKLSMQTLPKKISNLKQIQ